MWYEYFQTDVDDRYVENDKLCTHILIEAKNEIEANKMAQRFGICFEEDYGYESHCCRWQRCYYELEFPSVWDKNLRFTRPEDYCEFIYGRRHRSVRRTKIHSRIFYKDGRIAEIGHKR